MRRSVNEQANQGRRRPSARRLFVAVAYDIADDRRRAEVARILGDFGTRVQPSVFECRLSAAEAGTLEARLRRAIRPPRDMLRIYRLCGACRERVEGVPSPAGPPQVQFV